MKSMFRAAGLCTSIAPRTAVARALSTAQKAAAADLSSSDFTAKTPMLLSVACAPRTRVRPWLVHVGVEAGGALGWRGMCSSSSGDGGGKCAAVAEAGSPANVAGTQEAVSREALQHQEEAGGERLGGDTNSAGEPAPGDSAEAPGVAAEGDGTEKVAEKDREPEHLRPENLQREWKVFGAGKGMGADWRAGGDADGTKQEVPGATWEGLTEEEAEAAIAGPTPPRRSKPMIKYGVVSSDKMHKTVMVKVPYTYIVPIYGKRLTRYSKIMAHDETNALRVGDHVGIEHVHQRYSKRKAHKVVEVRRVLPRLDDENALPPLEKVREVSGG